MGESFDIVIVGSGFGGLLAGAYLSKEYRVCICEKLNYIGGRFTNIFYKGFQLSTGALHTFPHRSGIVVKALKELGIRVELKNIGRVGVLEKNSIKELNKTQITKSLILYPFFNTPRIFDAIYRFSIGISSHELSFFQKLKFITSILRFGRPVVPIGGCQSIINSLAEIIKSQDGKIYVQTEVKKILTERNKVKGVLVKRKGKNFNLKSGIVISDIGQETARLLSPNFYDFSVTKPVEGIKINISFIGDPPFEEYGLIFTPECNRIAGFVIPSLADPSLAPAGKHLIMTHQELRKGDIKKEIELGLNDIKNIFDKGKYKVLLIQIFKGKWPVNRTPQGQNYPFRFQKLKGLYMVGDAIKPDGFLTLHVMTEGMRIFGKTEDGEPGS